MQVYSIHDLSEQQQKQLVTELTYPDVDISRSGKAIILPTLDNFRTLLRSKNITLSLDIISRRIEVPEHISDIYSTAGQHNALLSMCCDLCTREHIKVNRNTVAAWLEVIADEHRFNPVRAYLEALPPAQGNKTIRQVFDCLKLQPNGNHFLHFALFQKWLVQCVAMAHNENGAYGSEFALVLHGRQGIGKTTFFKLLFVPLARYFKEGSNLDLTNKDSLIENLCYWVVELGELETTTRGDMGKLKAFLTRGRDLFRAPYGYKSEDHPRMTVFCGTVNDRNFLRDNERRFVVLSCEAVDLAALEAIDMHAFWAEVYALWKAEPFMWRLSESERTAVMSGNEQYKSATNEEQAILDSLDWESTADWHWLSSTEISKELFLRDSSRTGKALRSLTVPEAARGENTDGDKLRTRMLHGCSRYFVPIFRSFSIEYDAF